MTTKLVESVGIEVIAVPVDAAAGAQASDWLNMKYYSAAAIVIMQGAWGAGTPAITLNQATSSAGAGSKPLAFTKRWSKTALGTAVFAETAVVNNTFNLPAVANSVTIVEVNAEDLDVTNGFTYIQAAAAAAGAGANLLAVLAILTGARYMGQPSIHLPAATV
jgi:hypothetical protein